jgi:hypothetical protein
MPSVEPAEIRENAGASRVAVTAWPGAQQDVPFMGKGILPCKGRGGKARDDEFCIFVEAITLTLAVPPLAPCLKTARKFLLIEARRGRLAPRVGFSECVDRFVFPVEAVAGSPFRTATETDRQNGR